MINYIFWLIFIQLGIFFVTTFILAMSFYFEWRAEKAVTISKHK